MLCLLVLILKLLKVAPLLAQAKDSLLQKSKILVLDEPTANVDNRTDKLQDAVNESFAGSAIISVAHRLDSVIENDLILVLGDGEVSTEVRLS